MRQGKAVAAGNADPSRDLDTDPLLAGVPVDEGYKVLGGVVLYEKIGSGGMGAVYRGRHLRLDIDVAVKVMAPPAGLPPDQAEKHVRRFLREARTAATVKHPNLIRVYDVNSESGVHFIIMDYVDGESAAGRLKRRGRLSEEEAVEIALGAAEGLAAAHGQGTVHRDVKPDNILIDKAGDVVVADLGLAKAYAAEGEAGVASKVTETQTAVGTPHYMSPEQIIASRDLGPRTDVWSLGVTLYQLLTGQVPWSDSSLFLLANKIRNEPVPDPKTHCAGLSDAACAIITKATRKDSAERCADCGEMAKVLRAHLDSIRQSATSALPDAEAGSTSLKVAGFAPPDPETLTLIGASLVAVGEASSRGQAALAEAAHSRTPVLRPELQDVVECLNAHHQRATYEAVAGVVGGIARGIGKRLGEKTPNNSWVVAKTGPGKGLPTDYPKDKLHPNLRDKEVIEKAEELRRWLATHARSGGKGVALDTLLLLLALGSGAIWVWYLVVSPGYGMSFSVIAVVGTCAFLLYLIRRARKRPSGPAMAVCVAHENGVLKASIGVESLGGLFEPVLEKGQSIPLSVSRDYSTTVDDQPALDIRVLQGHSPLARSNVELAAYRLTGLPPAPRGVPQIRVTFRVNENGQLALDADELFRGKKPRVNLLSSNELSARQVAVLREPSESGSASDEEEASLIRARNEAHLEVDRARELIGGMYRATLSKDEAKQISNQIAAVQKAKSTGPAADLESATRALRASTDALLFTLCRRIRH